MNNKNDEELMDSFRRSGDRNCFNLLMRRYTPKALNVAFYHLYDHHDAQDAIQETFIRVFNKSQQYKSEHLFAPWFFGILRNTCIDTIRRKKIHKSALEHIELVTEQEDPPQPPMTHDNILKFLNTLPEKERSVLHFRFNLGMKINEIAALSGCSEEAAKKRAQRGLCHLKELIQKSTAKNQNSPEKDYIEKPDHSKVMVSI
jgi:RNA polymerase sigma-70 factor (ECF subfamily)